MYEINVILLNGQQMKILQVINNFSRGGGAEKVVFDLAIALSSHPNIEVSILSIQKPSDGEYVEEVYAYCNLHGLWKC